MPTDLQEFFDTRTRLVALKAKGRSLLVRLAASGYDLASPNFLDRVRSDLATLTDRSEALEADLGRLLNNAKKYGVVVSPTEISAPDHDPGPTLGTTIGDQPGLPNSPETAEETKVIDQLNDRLYNPGGPGTGTKLGTGEAAGNWVPDDPSLIQPPNEEQARKNETERLNRLADRFEAMAKSINDLLAAKLRVQAAFDAYTKALRKQDKLKLPNPDATDGSWRPKHPLEDPWSELLKRPKKIDPLGDPNRGEGTSGPSDILVTRGQATDPVPGDAKDEPGAKKIIRTTFDAVTDPPRDRSVTPGFFARILNLFR
jgi:hypothetical protein